MIKVQNNSQNGIVVDAGTITVDSSDFALNGESAILIEGGNSVTISNDVIESNAYGLTLSGQLTGTVQIQQNEIINNTQAGILIDAKALDKHSNKWKQRHSKRARNPHLNQHDHKHQQQLHLRKHCRSLLHGQRIPPTELQ